MSKPLPPPVVDPNPPRPARPQRAAPPDDPAPAQQPAVADPPPAPAAQVPQQAPAPVAEPEQAAAVEAPQVGTALAHQGSGDLIGGRDGVSVLAELHKLRRKVIDPMNDYDNDSTRVPRFIKKAAQQVSALRGVTLQVVYRDAMLGIDPLPDDALAAALVELYGPHMQDWRPGDPVPR